MKTTFALILCVALVGISFAAEPSKPANQQYTSKFDNINVDQILNNKRLLKNYIACLLEDKGCNASGLELKRVLPDALKTNCEKCTPVQQQNSKKVITKLSSKEYANDWEKLLKKYDPENIYRTKYAPEAQKLGVSIPAAQ